MKTSQPPMRQGSSDDFQTPEEALDILVPFLNKNWTVWECACGKGNLVNGLIKRGFDVIGTDIKIGDQWNFLFDKPVQWDCIVTNPPYTIKEDFIRRCYDLGTPFALLMPLTALESEKRQSLFRKYGVQVIIPNKRYNFETPFSKGSGSWFLTAWFTWGLNLPKDLTFVNVNDFKRIKND